MATVRKRRGRIQLRLDERERAALLGIVERLDEQARSARPLAAAPRAYEDEGKQAEYERWVRPEIERGHQADLDVIRDGLTSGEPVLVLTEAQVYAWLRGFNRLRIAAGATLGISEDGWETTATPDLRGSPEYGMLIALGWLQEEMVAALET